MSEIDLFSARATAGRAAVVIANEHDREKARDVTCGLMTGFIEAMACFDGWDATLAHIHQLAANHHVPQKGTKPRLIFANEAS